MKMPEPKAWIKYLIGAEAKPNGQCYDIVFTPVDGYSPLYDKQALIDLLEEAAEMCELFDATDPKYLAVEIRRMKEKL